MRLADLTGEARQPFRAVYVGVSTAEAFTLDNMFLSPSYIIDCTRHSD
jgi:hypothetical protein